MQIKKQLIARSLTPFRAHILNWPISFSVAGLTGISSKITKESVVGFFSSRPKPFPSIPPGGSPSSRYKSASPTLREKTDYKWSINLLTKHVLLVGIRYKTIYCSKFKNDQGFSEIKMNMNKEP